MASFERMYRLAANFAGLCVSRGYNYLIFLFDQLSVVADLPSTSLCKVFLWMVLSSM